MDEWILKRGSENISYESLILKVSKTDSDNILSFRELFNFSERFLIVSLTKPYGTELNKLLGVNGITKEDLVCLCNFLIRDWESSGAKNE